jgi:hypothetical protein
MSALVHGAATDLHDSIHTLAELDGSRCMAILSLSLITLVSEMIRQQGMDPDVDLVLQGKGIRKITIHAKEQGDPDSARAG